MGEGTTRSVVERAISGFETKTAVKASPLQALSTALPP
jgi:hypothetical protein